MSMLNVKMGTGCASGRRFGLWLVLVFCVPLAAEKQEVCSADDACHFGSCEQKLAAVKFVRQNLARIDCEHPYVVGLLTYINRASSNYAAELAALNKRCGSKQPRRPACETRRTKSPLDTILILIFGTACIFKIAPDLEPQWDGA